MTERKLRFIKEEPWIAQILRQLRFIGVVPEDLRNWFWDWVEDVGRVVRSREYMVSCIASGIYYVGISLIVALFPILHEASRKLPIFSKFLEGLGVRLRV